MFRYLVLFAAMLPASAQLLTFGGKVGSPINNPGQPDTLFPLSFNSQGRWLGGPTVELHLPKRFSVVADALYRTDQNSYTYPLQIGTAPNSYLSSYAKTTKAWEFPLLLKYRLTDRSVNPFVTAGVLWSHQKFTEVFVNQCLGASGSCQSSEYPYDLTSSIRTSTLTRFGQAVGGGIDIHKSLFTISPEVRVQRIPGPTRYQVTALIGFTFGRRSD